MPLRPASRLAALLGGVIGLLAPPAGAEDLPVDLLVEPLEAAVAGERPRVVLGRGVVHVLGRDDAAAARERGQPRREVDRPAVPVADALQRLTRRDAAAQQQLLAVA